MPSIQSTWEAEVVGLSVGDQSGTYVENWSKAKHKQQKGKKTIIDSDRRKLDIWWYMLSEEVYINCANMIVW